LAPLYRLQKTVLAFPRVAHSWWTSDRSNPATTQFQ
jgi:hypothetical protein